MQQGSHAKTVSAKWLVTQINICSKGRGRRSLQQTLELSTKDTKMVTIFRKQGPIVSICTMYNIMPSCLVSMDIVDQLVSLNTTYQKSTDNNKEI